MLPQQSFWLLEVNEDEGKDEVATCKRGPVNTASECQNVPSLSAEFDEPTVNSKGN